MYVQKMITPTSQKNSSPDVPLLRFLRQHGAAWFAAELTHFLDLESVLQLDTAMSARAFRTTAWLDVLRVLSVEQLTAYAMHRPSLQWVVSRGIPITAFKWKRRNDHTALTLDDVITFLDVNPQVTELDICVTECDGRLACPLLEGASALAFTTLARHGHLLTRLCLYASFAFSTGPRAISARGMTTLLAHCPALEVFHYHGRGVTAADHDGLFAALSACPALHELVLAHSMFRLPSGFAAALGAR